MTTYQDCRDFIKGACEADPYLCGLRSSLSDEEFTEFLNHFSGMLKAFVRQESHESEIKDLLDANRELDRQKLADAINRLALIVGYTPEQAGLERV